MTISAAAPGNTRISWKIYYGIVILIAAAMAMFVHHKAAGDYAKAVANYRLTSGTDANIAAHRVDEAFTQIYQNLRTISLLPSVRGIDRHGTNLSTNDHVSVQQIYNNMFSNVAVSEVYIVPKDLNADTIDPVTKIPQVPILMFDSEISGDDSGELDLNKPEEVEVYEYRLLHKQGTYFQQHFPTQSTISGLDVPVVSGPEVITCDNSVFSKSRIDSDRKGFILSVPFYGADGALKGMISAITRTDTIKSLLPATDAALVNSGNGYIIDAAQPGQQQASATAVADGTADASLMFSTAIPLHLNDPQHGWTFWMGHSDQAFFNGGDLRALRTFEDAGYGITLVLAAIALAALWMIEHQLVRPVTMLADAIRRAAAGGVGDESATIPGTDRKDYLGEMARAVAKFHEGMRETDRLRANQEESRERAELERAEALSTMADKVEHETRSAVAQLAANSKEMASDADIMAHSVASLGQNSHDVAHGAAQSLATAQIVASAAEEMRASIEEIGRQMRIAMTVTNSAVSASSHAQETIRSLSEAVNRIGEVTKLIKTIASQTNLLALNATIEAARAGESGKGFAVVASEVKLLASQTAKATEEIAVQIQEIRARTAIAVEAVVGITQTIGEVESVSKCVAVAVEEQSAATAEITRNIVGTATAAQEVSQSIALVSSEAAATGRRADGVSTAARSTAEAVEELRRVLIQIVRTSSEFAERRKSPRFELNVAGSLSLLSGTGAAGAIRARGYVEDCSEMGARFRGELPGVRVGSAVDLTIDGLNYPLRANVRGVFEDVVQLEFDLKGSATAARFKADFAGLTMNSRKLMAHA